MLLKELEPLLRGLNEFYLQSRDEKGNIITLDKARINELKFLPASITRRKILEIDLEKNEIFLDKDWQAQEDEIFKTRKDLISALPDTDFTIIENQFKYNDKNFL